MTRTPTKPPIVHRLKARRAGRTSHDIGPMFWGCVAVAVAGLYGILVWGGR